MRLNTIVKTDVMANNRIKNFYDEIYSNGIAYGNCFPIDIP